MRRDYENDEEDLGALYGQSGNVRDDEAPPRAGHNRGVDEDDALEELSLEDIMKEGRKLLFIDLYRAVKGGYATPAEKNTFRQMLKDNGMVLGDPEEGARGGENRPKAELPAFSKPEYE
ncbi:hypothetical protein F9K91_24930 [Brucella tritici]|uniref:Uncharacterized protein n=1 Tax=Brucella tritici TaxID=94626 RepID=A0A833CH93_9HYPH|nr:hypothetical protein [Brucella tritici]KAB2661446.1 hypothetical protein F9K91_24930 [Brucella tritici]